VKTPHAIACAAAVAALLAATPARGADLTTLPALNQAEFRLLSEDLGAALSYKPLIPAEALGLPGFDLGVAIGATSLKSPVLLSKAAANASVPTTLPVPSARLTLGLPWNIDVGAMYARVPDVSMSVIGGELRWAVLPGSTLLPAVALRAAATRLQGVDQLEVATNSVDLSISKGFVMLTPYGGVGQVWVTATPDRSRVPNLREEKFTQTKFFAGVNVNLGINMAFELDSTGGITTYSAKVGLRF
jgi:hypothetical protein